MERARTEAAFELKARSVLFLAMRLEIGDKYQKRYGFKDGFTGYNEDGCIVMTRLDVSEAKGNKFLADHPSIAKLIAGDFEHTRSINHGGSNQRSDRTCSNFSA